MVMMDAHVAPALGVDRAGCARRPAVAGAADSPGRLPRRVGIDAYNECGKVAASQLRRLSYPLR